MTNKMTVANEVAKKVNGVAKEVEKANGYVATGIEIKLDDTNMRPLSYIDDMIELGLTADEIAEDVKEMAKKHKKPSLDMDLFDDMDFVKKHLRARLYNKATNAQVFRSAEEYGFEDLIIVPYLENVVENGSVKVNQTLLDNWCMSAEEVIQIAEENSRQEANIKTMAEVLSELLGMDYPTEIGQPQLLVISNDSRCFGAYSIIPLLESIKDMFPEGFTVLPSSVHEVLVTDGAEDGLDGLVQDVNSTEVMLTEQLSNHAYRFVA